MLKIIRLISKSRKGFTLVEFLVAIAIVGILSTTIGTTVTQLFTVQSADSNRMEAVKQVENALHYINRDVQMTWLSSFQANNPSAPNFPLKAEWIDYLDGNQTYTITYEYDPTNSIIRRRESVAGVEQSNIEIARHITAASYSFDGEIVTINLTSTIDGLKSATEQRALQIKLRTTS